MHDIEVSVFFMRDLRNQIGGDDASALIAFVCPGIGKGGGCSGFPEPSGNHTFRRIADCYSCVVD